MPIGEVGVAVLTGILCARKRKAALSAHSRTSRHWALTPALSHQNGRGRGRLAGFAAERDKLVALSGVLKMFLGGWEEALGVELGEEIFGNGWRDDDCAVGEGEDNGAVEVGDVGAVTAKGFI